MHGRQCSSGKFWFWLYTHIYLICKPIKACSTPLMIRLPSVQGSQACGKMPNTCAYNVGTLCTFKWPCVCQGLPHVHWVSANVDRERGFSFNTSHEEEAWLSGRVTCFASQDPRCIPWHLQLKASQVLFDSPERIPKKILNKVKPVVSI